MADEKALKLDVELGARKTLTFEQAEGVQSLPTQLQIKEISQEMRALLWAVIHESMNKSAEHSSMGYGSWFKEPWSTILKHKHVFREHRMIDDFENNLKKLTKELKLTFTDGDYSSVLGLVQWLLRQPSCPQNLAIQVGRVLQHSRSAYRLFDGDTIAPISSEHEAGAFQSALKASGEARFEGARRHLKDAAKELTNGNWAASIRESIHAVEAAAKIIVPGANTLGPALTALAKKKVIHAALQNGFSNLYGFTSDEQGIRHSLLEKGEAEVDAVDAQYMLGACAAFVSYLLARARQA
jgi:hypothetical protein